MERYTQDGFNRDFPTDDACLDFIRFLRWPNGITCRKCGRATKHHRVSGRPAYACDFCGNHVYPMAGTILEHSSTPLRKWLHAMFLMGATRTGISAKQLQREIGVTYKTAWRMFKQIRSMMDEEVMNLLGEVEVDETYYGGKRHGGKRGRGTEGKTPVFGMVERGGRVVARVVPNVQGKTVLPHVKEKVLPRSMVYTDEFGVYDALPRMGYQHRRVHHAAKVYVDGTAHTNTIEGFWSLVKRGISGVNHAVGAHYLQGYVNSYAFRWNHREDEIPMFLLIAGRLPVSPPKGE